MTLKTVLVDLALSNEYLLDQSIEAIAPLYKYRSSDIDYLKNQIEKIKIQLKLQLLNLASIYGICVGDVHSRNTHFTQQDELLYLILINVATAGAPLTLLSLSIPHLFGR